MNDISRYNVNIHNDERIAQAVDTPVPPELISTRSSGRDSTVSYLKGDIDADRMNEIFGPLGWSLQAGQPEISKFEDKRTVYRYPSGKNSGRKEPVELDMAIYVVTTPVTLTIKARNKESTDTVFKQSGVGYGEVEIGKHAKDAVVMAVKGAETDGFKRCASLLGKAFGMFLNADGSQSDIEYAHRNNNEGLKKARRIREQAQRSERSDDRQSDDEREASQRRDSRRDDRQRSRDRERDEREEPSRRRPDERSGRDRGRDEETGSSREVDPENRSSSNDDPRNADEGQPRRKRPRAAVNDDFNLDLEPVTRDDQIAYGATLTKKLREAGGEKQRIDILSQHRKSIEQLDSNIRGRVYKIANEFGIDIDKIAA